MGQVFKDISMTPRGLVLVTGPTGSGKSTTLAPRQRTQHEGHCHNQAAARTVARGASPPSMTDQPHQPCPASINASSYTASMARTMPRAS